MYKIKIYTIGKHKEVWLNQALEEYTTRLQSRMQIIWHLSKTLPDLSKEKNYIALDPKGKQMTSEAFSTFLYKELEIQGSHITFIIGGSEGLPPLVKSNARALISLSKLTFTHQITRLILLEQLYRAAEIERGSAYHK